MVRRPMSSEEREMARALGHCRFLPCSHAKRFASGISGRAQTDDPDISERESAYLRGLVYTFRRQIPADVVTLAGDVPRQRRDFRAQQEWRDGQVAIAELVAAAPATPPAPPTHQPDLGL